MKSEIEKKLNIIASIWNNFIWEYKFCGKKIKFSEDVKSNYFGDILGYFQDTFEIILTPRDTKSYVDRFSYHMSLLQAIYIQQDFIEELLIIFKCDVNKGALKRDDNYSINREIRNELVGHPIRKKDISSSCIEIDECDSCGATLSKPKKKSVLLSSTLFSYESDNDTIQYLRYHRDNDYNFETRTFKIDEIIARHIEFLSKYFDIILNKLIGILRKYNSELTKLTNQIEERDFETTLKLVGISFESIFNSDYIYDIESLLRVHSKRKEHERYQNLIDKFNKDLRNAIAETKDYIQELIEPKQTKNIKVELPKVEISFSDFSSSGKSDNDEQEVSYHYEIGKLGSKRDYHDFEFFSGCLKSKCMDNELVINELEHMENNLSNDIEYYTAFRLICKELKE